MNTASMDESVNGVTREEILFLKWDTALAAAIPVKLITYPDGTLDLFRQKGSEFEEHIQEARALLAKRDLEVGLVEVTMRAGAYLPVWPSNKDLSAIDTSRTGVLQVPMAPYGHAEMGALVYGDRPPSLNSHPLPNQG